MSNVMRTDEMVDRYHSYKETDDFKNGCVLCRKTAFKEFKYWKLTKNDFPYNKIAEEHNMIVPIRHATEAELTPEEKAELLTIKENSLYSDYDYIIETSQKHRSIPAHFHLHLVRGKTDQLESS